MGFPINNSGRNIYGHLKILAAATAVGATPQVPSEPIDEIFPGIKESPTPLPFQIPEGAPRTRIDYYLNEELPEDYGATAGWQKARSGYQAELDRSLATGNAPAGVKAWTSFIQTLKNAKNVDTLTKIEAMHGWVDEFLEYDNDKLKNFLAAHKQPGEWDQSPLVTLTTQKGECGDATKLWYEGLKAIGIEAKDMRLVSAALNKPDGTFDTAHEILVVNVDGKNLALEFIPKTSSNSRPIEMRGGVYTVNDLLHTHGENVSGMVPVYSSNENGIAYYPVTPGLFSSQC